MKHQKFSIKARLKSFVYAFDGLKTLVKEEHNSWIHLVAAIGVILASVFFELSTSEWFAVILSIAFVFSMELINSAIENMADMISNEKNETIRKIKDLAAAAVLVAAFAAFMVGIIIFIPKILNLG